MLLSAVGGTIVECCKVGLVALNYSGVLVSAVSGGKVNSVKQNC